MGKLERRVQKDVQERANHWNNCWDHESEWLFSVELDPFPSEGLGASGIKRPTVSVSGVDNGATNG